MKIKLIQITSGRGPAECCWVVAQVLKALITALKENKLSYTIIQKEQGQQNRTLRSVTLQIEGEDLNRFLTPWLGTIQWVGKSAFRPQHRRKNWYVGLFEVDYSQDTQFQEKDIIYQTTRSSGPGGQHANKVSSAVRAIHKPTKTQVFVMESRSQHQNKKIAKHRLKERINELQLEALKTTVKSEWTNHLNLERGNPVKVFTGTDFKVSKKTKRYKSKRYQLKADLKKELE